MPRKPSRWGLPGPETIFEENGWIIGIREFRFTDAEGGSIWQWKKARDRYFFDTPSVSHMLWESKKSPRKDCLTREEALAAVRAEIARRV